MWMAGKSPPWKDLVAKKMDSTLFKIELPNSMVLNVVIVLLEWLWICMGELTSILLTNFLPSQIWHCWICHIMNNFFILFFIDFYTRTLKSQLRKWRTILTAISAAALGIDLSLMLWNPLQQDSILPIASQLILKYVVSL